MSCASSNDRFSCKARTEVVDLTGRSFPEPGEELKFSLRVIDCSALWGVRVAQGYSFRLIIDRRFVLFDEDECAGTLAVPQWLAPTMLIEVEMRSSGRTRKPIPKLWMYFDDANYNKTPVEVV